jgi:hypothetical protein
MVRPHETNATDATSPLRRSSTFTSHQQNSPTRHSLRRSGVLPSRYTSQGNQLTDLSGLQSETTKQGENLIDLTSQSQDMPRWPAKVSSFYLWWHNDTSTSLHVYDDLLPSWKTDMKSTFPVVNLTSMHEKIQSQTLKKDLQPTQKLKLSLPNPQTEVAGLPRSTSKPISALKTKLNSATSTNSTRVESMQREKKLI